jgi:hypothetical protein
MEDMTDADFRVFVAAHFEERDKDAAELRAALAAVAAALGENTRITQSNNERMQTIFAIMTFSENTARWTVRAGRILSRVAKVLIPIVVFYGVVKGLWNGELPKLKDFL